MHSALQSIDSDALSIDRNVWEASGSNVECPSPEDTPAHHERGASRRRPLLT